METIGRVFTPEGDIFGIDWSTWNSGEEKRRKSTTSNEPGGSADVARKKAAEAEATVLAEQKAVEDKKAKRASLLGATTSGFGANTNLARSFLTSL
jgi:hypothetical protein